MKVVEVRRHAAESRGNFGPLMLPKPRFDFSVPIFTGWSYVSAYLLQNPIPNSWGERLKASKYVVSFNGIFSKALHEIFSKFGASIVTLPAELLLRKKIACFNKPTGNLTSASLFPGCHAWTLKQTDGAKVRVDCGKSFCCFDNFFPLTIQRMLVQHPQDGQSTATEPVKARTFSANFLSDYANKKEVEC